MTGMIRAVMAGIIGEVLGEALSAVFSEVISWIESLVHFIEGIGDIIAWAIIEAWNGLVTGIDIAIEAVFSILPHFPSAPELALPEALRWFNWMIPIPTILTVWSTMIGIWLLWQALRIIFNWLKAA